MARIQKKEEVKKTKKKSNNTAKETTKKKSKNKKKDDQEIIFRNGEVHSDEEMELFFSSRKTVKELIAPLGVNPNPLEYMELDDNGVSLYTMCFYIHKLPRRSHFATTYSFLFNTPGVTSTVFISPMVAGKSSQQLDKRILVLDSEGLAAANQGDRNRYRKIMGKLKDTERYARNVESGDNQLFEVAFLFTVQADSVDKLRIKISDMHMAAREKGIELHACFSVHPEAFLSGYPLNKVQKAQIGIAKSSVLKWHPLDKNALVDIFNHTRSGFSHKDGIYLGLNMHNGQPVMFDAYDPSHSGFGVSISGMTGTGKSAMFKMLASRYIDFGYVIRSIDFEARGSRGEYSLMAEAVGGTNIQIKPNTANILNLFDLEEEEEFDEITGKEYKVLNLATKKVDCLNLIMTMIKNGRTIDRFEDAVFIERIVADTISQLYEERGIIDQDVDSLYTRSQTLVNGVLGSGMVKKELPTITDFYKKILINQKQNKNPYYSQAFAIVRAAMKDYVKELYFCPECLHFYSKEEYDALATDEDGKKVCVKCAAGQAEEIHGMKAYFDGQTTVKVDASSPHINIDISQLQKDEKVVALLVALSYMQENFIKKNSANIKVAKKMIVAVDELHKTFPYLEARLFISDVYRTARKRNVSPWTMTQALADYAGYKETEAIVKNSACIILLKQQFQDREYIKKATPLTDSQIEQVLSLGGDPSDSAESSQRKGEICIIDNQSKVAFVKVDYLTDSEARIVETDIHKIMKMYKGNSKVNAG